MIPRVRSYTTYSEENGKLVPSIEPIIENEFLQINILTQSKRIEENKEKEKPTNFDEIKVNTSIISTNLNR